MCVRLHSEKSKLRCWYLKRRLAYTPRRHRLADGQLSSLYPPSPSFSSFGAAYVMCCSTPPACSSTPLRPSVHYPSVSLAVNIIYIQTFCENLHFVYIFDQADLDRVEVRLEFNGANARQIVSPPSLSSSHPRRHRQADGKLSPLTPSCQV